ncbi:pregnancy-specific beta-1-glycoprotein 5-like [Hoplias malabaricus]|uniref:pregnancy-specific beta-1-glycoprotein 5-like n=1 Tax=Hoplias malabaricus TaxID=27720 RepID=UPI0034618DE0
MAHSVATLLFILSSVGPAFGVVYLQIGTNYTLQPKITGKPQNILWKFKGTKVVEYENNNYYWYKDYESRGQLDILSGNLELKNLRKDDTGLYQSEIQVDGRLHNSDHNIEVMGPVFGVVSCRTGTNYTLQPKITGKPQNILWKFKGTKVVEYENNNYYWYKDYESRGQLDIQSGNLELKNLRKDDTGLYQSEIQVDGRLHNSDHNIEVMGPVFGVVYLQTGTNYTLQPKITGKPQNILWKFKGSKMVEYGNSNLDWYKDYESRGKLDIQSGDLTLKNLRKDDTGLYQSEIQVDGRLHFSDHNIEVMDGISQPKVSCQDEVTLTCSVDPGVQAEFEWTGPDGFEATGERLNISQVIISKIDSVFFCTAKNKVSESRTSFILKDCYKDAGHYCK